ncbi:CPBP family intramembrane glutamic endopeptidase [Agromyces aerolatus]|uniref:CPBP family intramembrane glutamic endopeptidase n=1 Tax=Agromyces sp. LY-1074 TaxID=3074080 RepID=UPI00286707F8|nr:MULTISPECIES: CPBP family intramembrane glutamic endopeptidase [unclassified Agromyces]MDR5701471.1 CPBP family intramembrane glutamic endopeptidase [Agromyces sp. LY-1074]MDR5704462.1 CPBP family intramembrane glutamic endopeptidase [Agromyces sp. LY-1358]
MPHGKPIPRTGANQDSFTRPQSRVTLLAPAAAVVIAVVAMLAWSALVRTVIVPAWLQAVGAYLVVWVPLGVAVVVAARGARRSGGAPLFARPWIRPIDLLWGVGAGFMMRGVSAVIELVVLGRMSGTGLQLEIDPTMAWFTLLLAPVLLGPVIEECFFRGLTLPTLRDATDASGASRATSTIIAVLASSALFALLHTLESPSPTLALVTGLSTFAFGLAAAVIVVLTGRIGGAIVAHIVYNAMLILLLVM